LYEQGKLDQAVAQYRKALETEHDGQDKPVRKALTPIR
jgi:hypothetical protein